MQEDNDEEEEQAQAQKKVASVIERWESRSISADALQRMRDRACAGQRTDSTQSSAGHTASDAQVPSAAMLQSPAWHPHVQRHLL